MTKREDVIDAARKLMRARNAAGFSMRTLAEVAGVSIATPYNLFGSKQAIVAAVMDADLVDFRDALFREPKSPIEIFFHLVEVSAALFEASPGFYRAGLSALEAQSDSALANQFGLPRHALLRSLVIDAMESRHLNADVGADALAVALGQQFFGWMQAWSRNRITLEDMVTRSQYGFALTLAGAAKGAHRGELLRRAAALQSRLPEAAPEPTSTRRKEAVNE